MSKEGWQWAGFWYYLMCRRCKARLSSKVNKVYWGRCELVKGHEGPHAIERGMEIISFWT